MNKLETMKGFDPRIQFQDKKHESSTKSRSDNEDVGFDGEALAMFDEPAAAASTESMSKIVMKLSDVDFESILLFCDSVQKITEFLRM